MIRYDDLVILKLYRPKCLCKNFKKVNCLMIELPVTIN